MSFLAVLQRQILAACMCGQHCPLSCATPHRSALPWRARKAQFPFGAGRAAARSAGATAFASRTHFFTCRPRPSSHRCTKIYTLVGRKERSELAKSGADRSKRSNAIVSERPIRPCDRCGLYGWPSLAPADNCQNVHGAQIDFIHILAFNEDTPY